MPLSLTETRQDPERLRIDCNSDNKKQSIIGMKKKRGEWDVK